MSKLSDNQPGNGITPNDVIAALKSIYGIKMVRSTLLRYEYAGLIPVPERGGGGKGYGRWTLYPPGTVELVVIAHRLIHEVIKKSMSVLCLDIGGTQATKILADRGVQDLSDAPEILEEVSGMYKDMEELFVYAKKKDGTMWVRWCGDFGKILEEAKVK